MEFNLFKMSASMALISINLNFENWKIVSDFDIRISNLFYPLDLLRDQNSSLYLPLAFVLKAEIGSPYNS